MQLLLTNDDGVWAKGIYALAKQLSKNYEIIIVAPDSERSGAGHSFTFTAPIRIAEVKLPGLSQIPTYEVSGTPVDCVKIACGNICPDIDYVISGINMGANLGTDVLYSGTVSAAMDAMLLGIPAIAVSNYSTCPQHIDDSAVLAAKAVDYFIQCKDFKDRVININIPDLPFAEIKGTKFTQLSRQEYEKKYIERVDPHNRKYYWSSATKMTAVLSDEDNDERWISQGYITVTPLNIDIADQSALKRLQDRAPDFTVIP